MESTKLDLQTHQKKLEKSVKPIKQAIYVCNHQYSRDCVMGCLSTCLPKFIIAKINRNKLHLSSVLITNKFDYIQAEITLLEVICIIRMRN